MMSNVAPDEAAFAAPPLDLRDDISGFDPITSEASDASEAARRHAAIRRLEATDRRRLAARLDSAIQEHGFALRYAPRLTALTAAAEASLDVGRVNQDGLERSEWASGGPNEGRLRSARGGKDRFGHNRFDPRATGANAARSLFCGAELIIGVQHRRRGVVPVERYLRSVKRAPLIASVIVEGLTEALAEIAAWPAAWTLSVVVPPRLADLAALHQALSKVPPDQARRVAFMVDEATLISDGLDALDWLDALRSDGFGLILDRFGGRFGSLALLRSLPLTGVKLDRALLHSEPSQRQSNLVLTEASIAIGHDLGLMVIAGGVETETDYNLLQRLGIDAVQGNWAGAAVTASAIHHSPHGAPHAA